MAGKDLTVPVRLGQRVSVTTFNRCYESCVMVMSARACDVSVAPLFQTLLQH